MSEEKVVCKFCGEEFSKRGISNHEKYCSENLNTTTNSQVIITPNLTTTLKICGDYYKLVRGKNIKVTEKVADLLSEVNYC